MPQFKTPIQNSPYDPFGYEKQIEQLTGAKEQLRETPITAGDSSLNVLSGLEAEQGFSLLTSDPEAASTINETRAANQSGLELAGKMLYNIGTTALTEVAKVPGYFGGGIAALGDKITGGENPMSHLVDNFWVNAFEHLQEGAKKLIPTHISKDVQEGNLLTKATSGQWWATTGADGIGFLISMMAPGQLLKTLGIGAKIGTAGEALGNSSKWVGKLLTKTGMLEDVAKSGQFALKTGAPRAIDSFAAATLNTYAEAAAEGANTFDNVKQKAIAAGKTEEEAALEAGNAAAGVFKANMALLIGSNLLDEAWLWKGFSNTQKGASNKILDTIFKKADDGKRVLDIDALKSLSGKGWKDALKTGAKNFARQGAKEGFLEEGSQTTLQQNIEKEGDAGFVNNLYNVGANYFTDFMSNKELHESIFLGGVLGGGMSVFQTKNEIQNYNRQLNGTSAYNASGFFDKLLGRRDRKAQQGLKGLFSENYINNFQSITDIAEKDADGKPLFKDGKIVVDEQKLAELAESKANVIDAHIKYDMAVATGDKVRQDALSDVLTFNYLQPFLNQEGGYQVFKEHVPQLEEAWANQYKEVTGREATAEQRKEFSTSLQSKAEEFNNLYQEVESTHLPERFVKPTNTQEYQDWKSQLFSDKINLGLQNRSLQKTKAEVTKFKRGLGTELTDEEISKLDPVAQATIKFYNTIEKYIAKQEPKLKENYLKLFSKEGTQEHYDEFTKKRKDFKENAEEVIVEEAAQAQENTRQVATVQQIKDSATQQGYTPEDNVILENEEGKRYVMTTENEENFIYNEKGEKKKVTGKLIENLKLTVVPKEKIAEEQKVAEVDSARQAKFAVISEIVNYREQLYNKTTEDIKQANEELAKAEEDIKKFTKEIDTLSTGKNKKTAIKVLKEQIAKTDKIIKELRDRIDHLNNLKERYQLLLEEYKLYQSYLEQANISFSELKGIIEQELLNSIKDDSANISNDIVETQKAIDRLKTLTSELEAKLNKTLEMKKFLEDFLNSGTGFNALNLILLTKKQELYNIIKELFSFEQGTSYEDFLVNTVKENGLREAMSNPKFKNRFLRKAEEIAKNISPAIAEKYFGKFKITKSDVYKFLADKFEDINDDIEKLGLEAQDRADVKNQIVSTDSEIQELKKQLESASNDLNLQNLNKQFLVLEEINKDKVEKRFSDELTKGDIKEAIHTQKEPTAEPNNNPEKISEVFAERQLGVNRYVVGGLNIMYEMSGKNAGFDVLTEEGLPVQNPSIYQQVWYKTMDRLTSTDISKYNLIIYKAKYDDSNDLEKQISANNPNVSNRTDSDLFAVLLDEKNQPVKEGENFVFTSIWRPEVLYGDKPRIAPDAILQPLLAKIGVGYTPYRTFSPSKLKKSERAKINKYLDIKEGEFTLEQLYNKAVEEAREEYTIWYNSVVEYNNASSKVFVKPEGITGGKPLQRRDKDRKVIWGNILTNVPKIKLAKGTGVNKLTGAKLVIVPRSGQLVLGKNLTVPGYPGDTMMILNNETNLVPVKSRLVTEEEAMLAMYLLSQGDKGSNASVELPKGVSYKIGNTEIKDRVAIFFYQTEDKALNVQLKNFSLLHSIINYGQKTKQATESEEEYKKRSRGTIYAATKTKRIIYTDFEGNVHVVSISEVKQAFADNNFSNPKVANLLNFLKQKRFNISQNLVEQNNMFPYPKLVTKRDTSGKVVYEVQFDNSKSYYQHLLEGDNPVLTTNLVFDPNYPQFVQRNLYFNPMVNTTASKTKSAPAPKKKITKNKYSDLNDGITKAAEGEGGGFIVVLQDGSEHKSSKVENLSGGEELISGNILIDKSVIIQVKSLSGKVTYNKNVKIEPVQDGNALLGEVENTPPDLAAFNSLMEIPEQEETTTELPKGKENKNMFASLKPVSAEPLKTENPNMFAALKKPTQEATSGSITSLDDIPDEDIGQQYADKIYSPLELLEYKLKTGEIKQDCK